MIMNNMAINFSIKNQLKPWLVCFAASLFFFYEFIQMNMFNAISQDLMKEFGLSGESLGYLSSTYLFADVVCLFPAGMLLDRFFSKKNYRNGNADLYFCYSNFWINSPFFDSSRGSFCRWNRQCLLFS